MSCGEGHCGGGCGSCGSCGSGCSKKGKMLCPVSLGFAIGIATAIFMIVCGWVGYFWGYGVTMITQSASFYYGFAPTPVGGLIGGLWGLGVGFIFGLIVGLIYDLCMCCKGGCCHKSAQAQGCGCGRCSCDKCACGKCSCDCIKQNKIS